MACGCGFFESVLSNSLGTLLFGWVLEPVRSQFDYVRSFHDYAEKLAEKKSELAAERDRLHHDIEEAERQLQGIEGGVLNLLLKVEKILTDMESLENEMQQNKKCFIWCPNWWWRNRLSKKLAKKTLVITELLEKTAKFGQPRRVGYLDESIFQSAEFWSSKDFMVSKSSQVAFNQIIEALKDDNVRMIGLWGMGGVGKTTLVREVASQAKRSNLFDKVVIVTVSQKPNFERIRDEIAEGLFNKGRKSKQELWLMLQKEKSVLIVLDDVWATIDLKEEIGISVGKANKGCKMLLTTRRRQVCLSMECQTELKLGCLDEEEAWALFENKAGLRNCSDDAIRKVAKEVTKRCEGLPIAIVTLGSALKGKTLAGWLAASRRLKNRRLMDIEDIDQEQGNKNAYVCIEMSFDYLRNMETKICFLLCSLFPEDFKIDVEDLVRYAWGLQLYRDIDTIKEVRSEVHAAIEVLKNSCLLLDCEEKLVIMHDGAKLVEMPVVVCREKFVKMHDVVRGFALQIASYKREISFTVLVDEFEKWPMDESFERYTAISLKVNRINELPEGSICPNLKILLLGVGEELKHAGTRISSAFFGGMTALKVCSVPTGFLSSHVFQSLTNLRTLSLRHSDFSSLGKLKELQILNLEGSHISELPSEIGGLSNLRLLELSCCIFLRRIPPNLIRRLSKLEELYLDSTFIEWATSETGEEESNASLLELNSLPNMATTSLQICPEDLPKDFVFPKLKRYNINFYVSEFHPTRFFVSSRSLKVQSSSSLAACKELLGDSESLALKSLAGYTNLVPSLVLDEGRSNQLISLILDGCKDMKFLIDTTMQQAPTTCTAFSNLKQLGLEGMHGLEELCKGHQPQGFLQNLKILSIFHCKKMICGIPILQNLEELRVQDCDEMQVLFHGSPQPESLQSLKEVTIAACNKLTYIFPTSVAKSLCQLQILLISNLTGVEEIIQETEEPNICLQSLREVSVYWCHNLTSLSSLSHGQILGNLRKLDIIRCSKLEYIFPISMAKRLPQLKEVSMRDLPRLKGINGSETVLFTLPSLQVLHVTNCPQLAPFTISAKFQELLLSQMTERKQLNNMVQPEFRQKSPNMEYLTITNFEELFDAEYNLSSLESLSLYGLPELRVVWKDPIQVVNLQNLTKLEIKDCSRLRYILSTTIAPYLPQLRCLSITSCEELEQIIENDQTSSLDHHLQPICFPNLTIVKIERCRNLKSLFPVSVVADGLPKLEELSVIMVSELEQVFEQGEKANVSQQYEERVVQLHQLRSLMLYELPSLVSFIPGGCHFVFPSLSSLRVENCPKIATRFSVDSKKSAHAITELASRSGDQNIVEGSSTAQETTWPVGSNIEWYVWG